MAETFGSIAAVVGIDCQQLLFGERGGRVPCCHVSIRAFLATKTRLLFWRAGWKKITRLSFRPQNYPPKLVKKKGSSVGGFPTGGTSL